MRDGWREVTLDGVSTDSTYGYTASASDDPVGPRFLRITDIAKPQLLWDQVPYANVDSSADLDRYRLEPGDLVIGRTGATVGVAAVLTGELPEAVFASYLVRFRLDKSKVAPDFIRALFRSPLWKRYVAVSQTGTGQPQLNAKLMGAFRFGLPPLGEQRRIADLFKSIDEVERRQAALVSTGEEMLKGMERALCPVGPAGAGRTPLSSLAQYKNGRAFKPADFSGQGLPVIRIQHLTDPAAVCDRFDGDLSDKHAIDDGDVVFSWSGTLKVVRWNRGPAALNQHLFKVVPEAGIDSIWLTHVLRSALLMFERMTHGTTMKHITKAALDKVGIVVPDLLVQRSRAASLARAEEVLERAREEVIALERLRRTISSELFAGKREIPESYNRFLEGREDAEPTPELTAA